MYINVNNYIKPTLIIKHLYGLNSSLNITEYETRAYYCKDAFIYQIRLFKPII